MRASGSAAEKLAKKIARNLFTNGQGQHAVRLVLEGAKLPIDGGLGGWCESAVADRIAELLISEGVPK